MSGMRLYSAYGLVIASEIAFPELPLASGEPHVAIRFGAVPWIEHRATPHEEYVFNGDSGAFRIRDGVDILIEPARGAAEEVLRVLLLGRVMAFLLRQRGWLPLHSSGVAINRQCVLFLGPSGTGKSTTAAAFHRHGHSVLTDDVGAVMATGGRCVVQPGQSRIRLLQDAEHLVAGLHARTPEFQLDKHSYDLTDHGVVGQIPLSRIYVLETGTKCSTEKLPPAVAAALLHRHSFVKRLRSEPAVLIEHLRHCAAVASLVSVHRLIRPHSVSMLPGLVQIVERDLCTEGANAAETGNYDFVK